MSVAQTTEAFNNADLHKNFGDIACSMMGSLDLLAEFGEQVITVIHTDRGCYNRPRGYGPTNIYMSNIEEIDVIQGGEKRLGDAIRDVLSKQRRSPKAVVVLATCLTEMIGDDVRAVAEEVEEEFDVPIVPLATNGLMKTRPVEVAGMLYGALAKRFVKPRDVTPNEVAFVSYGDYQENFQRELRYFLEKAGLQLGGFWPSHNIDDLARLSHAKSILVAEETVLKKTIRALKKQANGTVTQHVSPFGLASASSFYELIGEKMGCEAELARVISPLKEELTPLIARFREKHGSRRVAVSFGNNRKGVYPASFCHLGIGFVPLLKELELEPVLIALTQETDEQRDRVRQFAISLGAADDVYVHRTPQGLVPILKRARVALGINESCQKHFVDEAQLPYLCFKRFTPGLRGVKQAIQMLDAALSD